MNCEQYLEQAFRRSKEISDGPAADSVSDHLLSCQDCLEASPVLKQFHQLESVPTPLSFLDDVLSKLEHNKTTIKCLDCEHAEEDLSAFLDGELSEEREEEIILHLANCDDCTLALSELKGLSGVLGRSYAKPMPIPADFAAMVTRAAFADQEDKAPAPIVSAEDLSSSSGQPMRIGPRPPFKAWLSAAAAVLITATIGVVMLNDETKSQKAGDMARVNTAPKSSGSTESILKMAAEQDKLFKESETPKPAMKMLPKKPEAFEPKAEARTLNEKTVADAGAAYRKQQPTPSSDYDDSEAPSVVYALSALNTEQARVDISLLVSKYNTLWENNGDKEVWELELPESEARDLVSRIKDKSNLQLAVLDLQAGAVDFFDLRRNDRGEGGKVYDPEADLENMKKDKNAAKTRSKRRGRPETKDAKPKAAPGFGRSNQGNVGKGNASSLNGIDTVVLKSGWNLSGTILEEGKDSLTMLTAGRKVNVRRSEIARLTRNARDGRFRNPAQQTKLYRIRLVLTTGDDKKKRLRKKSEKKK